MVIFQPCTVSALADSGTVAGAREIMDDSGTIPGRNWLGEFWVLGKFSVNARPQFQP